MTDLPHAFHSPLKQEDAKRVLVQCFSGPGSLIGAIVGAVVGAHRGRRPRDMTGWGWSKMSGPGDNGRYVFEVTRAPGIGSMKGLSLACQLQPTESGSYITIDHSGQGHLGRTLPGVLRSGIDQEVTLLRKELHAL